MRAAELKTWLDAALSFFYPEVCQLCYSEPATVSGGYVGARCQQRVRLIRPPFCECCGLPYEGDISTRFECSNCREMELHFRSARAAVVANDVVLDAIHRYKYERAIWFESFLAGFLVRAAQALLAEERWDMIVPVPLHPVKGRQREFNQAERLAEHLSAATQIGMNTKVLRRVEFTRTQTRLSRAERAANVRNAFALRRGCCLRGERIVLLDDVLTTGSTTSACARVLKKSGAGEVCVWTVARGV